MRRSLILLFIIIAPVRANAQDDWEAGLFTEGQQLPLVSQAQRVRITGGEAELELIQVFANEGGALAQADFRLHLPVGASVSAFGFWRGERFLDAELKEKDEARQAHHASAAQGRATGLLEREGSIHSFSVFPIAAYSLQQVKTTIRLPVATERGRSYLRLPMDSFLGHARIASTASVHIQADGPIESFGVDGVPFKTLGREARWAKLAFSADQSVDVWWSEEAPPLLTRGEVIDLVEGGHGVQLRVVLNDAGDMGPRYRSIGLLVDTSYSMRRRAKALADAVARIVDRASVPVQIVSVAETPMHVEGADLSKRVEALLSGAAGFRSSWAQLVQAARMAGCKAPDVGCVAITDPQIDGIDTRPSAEFETLFLADADELAYFGAALGEEALTYQPGVEPRARLNALADELVLPVLEVWSVEQPGGALEVLGKPRWRVAEGGLLRVFATSSSDGPLELCLRMGGRELERTVPLERLPGGSPQASALRRSVYRETLSEWMAEYRLSRNPKLREQVVALSLREKIPTALTSLHVSDPRGTLPSTATAGPFMQLLGWILTVAGSGLWMWRRRS